MYCIGENSLLLNSVIICWDGFDDDEELTPLRQRTKHEVLLFFCESAENISTPWIDSEQGFKSICTGLSESKKEHNENEESYPSNAWWLVWGWRFGLSCEFFVEVRKSHCYRSKLFSVCAQVWREKRKEGFVLLVDRLYGLVKKLSLKWEWVNGLIWVIWDFR